MKAILLAGGFGSRLRPLTNSIPKCLVPIGDKPLLQIWLERLERAGVSTFLINTHYLHEHVENFVESSPFKDRIILAYEETLLGTAGTLYANLDFYEGQDGMLIHADNFCLADMSAFIAAHLSRPKDCVLTVMAFRAEDPSACGIFQIDERNVAISFHEKSDMPPGNLANGAVYILSPLLMETIRTHYSNAENFSTDVIPDLNGKIFIHETDKPFLDIGTRENYCKANHINIIS